MNLPSIACRLSLNCICAHFDRASWVRFVEKRFLTSRSVFVNSWGVDVGFAVGFISVHGVLEEETKEKTIENCEECVFFYDDLLPLVVDDFVWDDDDDGWLSVGQKTDDDDADWGDEVECWKTPPQAGVEWLDELEWACCCCCCCCCCWDVFNSCWIKIDQLNEWFRRKIYLSLQLLLSLNILKWCRWCCIRCIRPWCWLLTCCWSRFRLMKKTKNISKFCLTEQKTTAKDTKSIFNMQNHSTTYMNIQKRKYRMCGLLIVGCNRGFRHRMFVCFIIGWKILTCIIAMTTGKQCSSPWIWFCRWWWWWRMRNIDSIRFGLRTKKKQRRWNEDWGCCLQVVGQQEQLLEHVSLVLVLVFVFPRSSMVDYVQHFVMDVEPNWLIQEV